MPSDKIFVSDFNLPFGELKIGSYKDRICLCDWKFRRMRQAIDQRIMTYLDSEMIEGTNELIELCKKQLVEYAQSDRTEFNVPLLLAGTPFQKSVWEELRKIPYGKTKSYKELSIDLGNIKALRAVASANGANAISILVPCHRIIGNKGDMVGYAGGVALKKRLLKLENHKSGDYQAELF